MTKNSKIIFFNHNFLKWVRNVFHVFFEDNSWLKHLTKFRKKNRYQSANSKIKTQSINLENVTCQEWPWNMRVWLLNGQKISKVKVSIINKNKNKKVDFFHNDEFFEFLTKNKVDSSSKPRWVANQKNPKKNLDKLSGFQIYPEFFSHKELTKIIPRFPKITIDVQMREICTIGNSNGRHSMRAQWIREFFS